MAEMNFNQGLASVAREQAKTPLAKQPASSNAGPLDKWRAIVDAQAAAVPHGPAVATSFHPVGVVSAHEQWLRSLKTTKV